MQVANLELSVVDVLLDFFTERYGEGEFKSFFYGDPIIFGRSQLPALIISETGTKYELGPTGFDDIQHTIQIKVVYDKKDEFGKPAAEAGLSRTIQNIVQGRDKTTGDFASNTIMGLLRTEFTFDGLTYNHVDEVQFNTVARPSEQVTEEALVLVSMNILKQVVNRQ